MSRHGGQILVDQLKIQGVRRVFCVPGESYLAVLDGLYESGIETIVGRQEGGVSMMAEAHGKLTGQVGVALVTRGPGATNASSAIHVAFQDSTPMVLFIGQVASDQRDREAFQEIEYRSMFASLAKWVAQIDRIDRIPEYISRAFHVAQSGRPGPVVLALPEDMLSSKAEVENLSHPARPARQSIAKKDIQSVIQALQSAQTPMMIVGGPKWSAKAASLLESFVEKLGLPVGTSFRAQDYIDNRHSHYVGDVGIGPNPKLRHRIENADLLLVLGARLGEITSGRYKLVQSPHPKQRLIHIHTHADEIGRVYAPEIGLCCHPAEFLESAIEQINLSLTSPLFSPPHQERTAYEEWQVPFETPGSVKMEQVICHLSNTLPTDAIITNGAGNYAAWLHRYYRYKMYRTQLAPTSGSMGYGLPAAVAAKLEYPERDVICLAGDGCFQMCMQEFGTAIQYGAQIIVVLSNNGLYGTIKMHQQRTYPNRPSATSIVNPDFAALAIAYGGYGETVHQTDDFPLALARARASGKPAVIELRTDPSALSHRTPAPSR